MTSIIDELNQEMWRIYLTPSDILARNLSYFEAPVTNTLPSGRVGLLDVFGKIFDSSFVNLDYIIQFYNSYMMYLYLHVIHQVLYN